MSPCSTWSTVSAPGSPHRWQIPPSRLRTISLLVVQSLGSLSLRVLPCHAGRWCVAHLPCLVACCWHCGSRHGVGASIEPVLVHCGVVGSVLRVVPLCCVRGSTTTLVGIPSPLVFMESGWGFLFAAAPLKFEALGLFRHTLGVVVRVTTVQDNLLV